jgi:hypothetical protein
LIKGLGFSTSNSSLLNIPFGAVQAVSILAGSYAAARFKIKSIMLVIQCGFTLAGGAMMYVAESGENRQQTLALIGYYFLAFSFGCSPIVYSWAIANVGGVSLTFRPSDAMLIMLANQEIYHVVFHELCYRYWSIDRRKSPPRNALIGH